MIDLAPFGLRVCSQGEEDGITLELARRLGIAAGTFVEIGVGRGDENNTRALVAHGWSGYWLDQSPSLPPDRVEFTQVTVTPENVCALVNGMGVPRSADLLSIDIDGNDYWVGKQAIPFLRPKILIVEYNHAWQGAHQIFPYTPNYYWQPGMDHGASLAAWVKLLTEYTLVYTTKAQVNAFFVRQDVQAQF